MVNKVTLDIGGRHIDRTIPAPLGALISEVEWNGFCSNVEDVMLIKRSIPWIFIGMFAIFFLTMDWAQTSDGNAWLWWLLALFGSNVFLHFLNCKCTSKIHSLCKDESFKRSMLSFHYRPSGEKKSHSHHHLITTTKDHIEIIIHDDPLIASSPSLAAMPLHSENVYAPAGHSCLMVDKIPIASAVVAHVHDVESASIVVAVPMSLPSTVEMTTTPTSKSSANIETVILRRLNALELIKDCMTSEQYERTRQDILSST